MAEVNLKDYFPGGELEKRVLNLLEKEEVLLKGVMDQLKRELGKQLGDMVSKEEQTRKLTGRVTELKEGGTGKKKVNRHMELNLEEVDHRFQHLSLLPEEVWRMIFANLTDWKDAKRCSQSCVLFRTILDPSKTTFVFDKVFPHLFKHLPGEAILECRRVCQAWKAGVDSFLENHKSLRSHEEENSDPRHPPFVNPMVEKGLGQLYTSGRGISLGWEGTSRMRQGLGNVAAAAAVRPQGHYEIMPAPTAFEGMLRDLRTCNTPFIGRDVYVRLDDNGTLDAVRRLLATFGNHIKYLTVEYSSDRELTTIITGYLPRYLPALEKLRLIGPRSRGNPQGEEDGVFWFLDTLLPPAPSPTLASLQIDDVEEPGTPAGRISLALLQKYHVQLRRLHVKASYFNQVSSLDWSNLVELHVKCFSKNINLYKKLFKMNLPNLKKVGFVHQAESNDPFYGANDASPSNRFVELINHLSRTSHVSSLRISGQMLNSFIGTVQSYPSYAPPTLKTLEVEHSRCRRRGPYGSLELGMDDVTCYTFLLNFPFLENLNLFWRKPDLFGSDSTTSEIQLMQKSDDFVHPWYTHPYCKTKQEMEIEEKGEWEAVEVHKYVYTGEMYKSNVWKVLPKLKVLTFQNQVYTREGYEKFKEQQQRGGE